jgi:hypothetical protein
MLHLGGNISLGGIMTKPHQSCLSLKNFIQITVLTTLLNYGHSLSSDNVKNENHDWHQWRRPDRNGRSAEKNILKKWSTDDSEILWRIPAGDGFSGV